MKKSHTTNFSLIFVLGSILLIVAFPVNAYKYQSTASIKQAVDNFLFEQLQTRHYRIYSLDKRLRLKLCSQELKVSFPIYAERIGRTTVEVSCNNSKPWKVLVSVYIQKFVDIILAKHALPAGSLISRSDIILKKTDVSRVRGGYFSNISQLTNMVVRRAIKTGRIISPGMLKPRQLVSRGDEVIILAQSENFRIQVKGKALMNGFLGQKINVKNLSSKRIFQATVISNGLVKVNM